MAKSTTGLLQAQLSSECILKIRPAMQVSQSAATPIVPVSITEFSVPSGTLYYGQALLYGAEVTTDQLFPGPFYWYNGTQIIATLPSLGNATTSSESQNGIVSPLCQAPFRPALCWRG